MSLESSFIPVTSPITADEVRWAIAHLTSSNQPTGSSKASSSLRLAPPEWSWNIHCIHQTPSTNAALWQWLDDSPDPSPDKLVQPTAAPVLIAHEQTHGRGQRARQWLSPPGGLYLSAAIPSRLTLTAQDTPMITLSTACGIAFMLSAAGVPIQLKWPNDLVVDGKKLGGILIESRLQGDRLSRCIVGVGINWMNPVPSTGVSLHSLLTAESAHHCRQLSDVAALVLLGIEAGIMHWKRHGKEAIAHTYTQFLNSVHQWIPIPETVKPERIKPESIETMGDRPSVHEQAKGQIIGVSPEGHLLVRVSDPHQSAPCTLSFAPGTISTGYGQQ
ncbi:MAG: biotin--[acetyl-CoA-carboxylase] ligase [Leptolyngbyaceae bacterium]|nr:biotin--[acetyl-CoA-carboxylase] ligase [Leptolyngbyaceae bacterium]